MPVSLPIEAQLPPHVAMALWRGHALGQHDAPVWPSGHAELDALLPGAGWPGQSLTEILQPPGLHAEWRLLMPVLRACVQQGLIIMLINPPHEPHAVGLRQAGLAEHHWLRVTVSTDLEALWSVEQVLKAGANTAVVAWMPHLHGAAVRRLQSCAARHPGPVFLFRPDATAVQPSAAPLRVTLMVDAATQEVQVQVLKRRGPVQQIPLVLMNAWPPLVRPLVERPLSRAMSTLPSRAATPNDHVALDRTSAIRQPAQHGVSLA